MRDLLEEELVRDAKDGDTTVLASVLEAVPPTHIFAALSDEGQNNIMVRFLNDYGIRTHSNEDPAMTDLMCDNHYHFTVNGQGFYVNKDLSMCTDDEQIVYDHLYQYHKG